MRRRTGDVRTVLENQSTERTSIEKHSTAKTARYANVDYRTRDQLLAGYRLREQRCSYCKTTFQEGDPVSAYAVQYAGDATWSIPRLYCRDCQSTITDPTLGATELLADGRLGCITDVATQQTSLTLLEIERIVKSTPEDGHATL